MEEVWECWGDWVGEGGSASSGGEKGGVWCVEGLCAGGGTVEGRFVAKAEKGGGGSVVGWGGGGV